MIKIFYSMDGGHIWYWGRYSKDDIDLMRRNGWRVMRDNKRNRMKLS